MRNFLSAFLSVIVTAVQFLCVSVLCSGCNGVDSPVLDPIIRDGAQIRYIALPPAWSASTISSLGDVGGFNRPTDLIIGYNNTFYVVDAGNNRILNLDEAGRVITNGVSQFIQRPKAIAQRRDLKLLVTATIDTTVTLNNRDTTITGAVIYELDVVGAGSLAAAVPRKLYSEPISNLADGQIRYTGIATLASNSFFVSRTGADADNAILNFPSTVLSNTTPTPIFGLDGAATASGYGAVAHVSSVATLAQPPQTAVNTSGDFLFVLAPPDSIAVNFKAQRYSFISSSTGSAYVPDASLIAPPPNPGQRTIGEPGRFKKLSDIAVAPDQGYLFVVDSQESTFYQFTAQGIEGIPPQTGAPTEDYTIVSFSTFGQSDALKNPEAVCYYNRKVYIVDTGNNRILVFQLSLDIDID